MIKLYNKVILSLFAFCITFAPYTVLGQFNRDRTVRLQATVTENPPAVTLKFQKFTDATKLQVYRKTKTANNWGTVYATLNVGDSTYTDTNIGVGDAYEYLVYKEGGTAALGYIYSGINHFPTDLHGAIALVVDETYQTALKTEIDELEKDLIGDGWQPYRIIVARSESVVSVKNKIKAIPNISAAFLFGNVPVPYSGNLNPDGHSNHVGAWACDGFYGDIDGDWYDVSVNNSSASRAENKNTPADGKYDASKFSSDVDLMIGRVDMTRLAAFSESDTALLRYYLQKNHSYRFGQLSAPYKAIVDDNFQSYTIASSNWRNFSSQIGKENILANTQGGYDYYTQLKKEWMLWSGGCGGGSYNSCGGVINTTQFATDSIKTIFTSLAGSYFGDWDSPNNLLRAALASKPSILASFWGGIPNWVLHHMALGESIGYGARLTQNEDGTLYEGNFNNAQRGVHIALMGDPTLRMHTTLPAASVSVSETATKRITVSWQPSPDSDIVGYQIYRAPHLYGVFGKVTSGFVTGSSFVDADPFQGNNVYMVRAVKKITSPAGTYYNLSQGVFDSVSVSFPANIAGIQKPLEVIAYPSPTQSILTVQLSKLLNQNLKGEIRNVLGQSLQIFTVSDQNITLNVAELPTGIYFVQISGDGYKGVTKFVKE